MTAMSMVSPAGSQVAGQIRDFVCRYPAKQLAAELSRVLGHTVEPRTVKSWREGATSPGVRHIEGLAALYGEAFIHHMFQPLLEESDANLSGRLDRLAADADRIAVDLRELRKSIDDEDQAGAASGRGAHHGRPCGSAANKSPAMGQMGARLSRGVQAVAIVLSVTAIGISLSSNDGEMLRSQVRSSGRPPAARVVRAGRGRFET